MYVFSSHRQDTCRVLQIRIYLSSQQPSLENLSVANKNDDERHNREEGFVDAFD